MDNGTIFTIGIFAFAIHSGLVYGLVRLLLTNGKPLLQKRDELTESDSYAWSNSNNKDK